MFESKQSIKEPGFSAACLRNDLEPFDRWPAGENDFVMVLAQAESKAEREE
jgi:hypothetical protein